MLALDTSTPDQQLRIDRCVSDAMTKHQLTLVIWNILLSESHALHLGRVLSILATNCYAQPHGDYRKFVSVYQLWLMPCTVRHVCRSHTGHRCGCGSRPAAAAASCSATPTSTSACSIATPTRSRSRSSACETAAFRCQQWALPPQSAVAVLARTALTTSCCFTAPTGACCTELACRRGAAALAAPSAVRGICQAVAEICLAEPSKCSSCVMIQDRVAAKSLCTLPAVNEHVSVCH